MKIVYISNILNHYQYALGNAFDYLDEVEYNFIPTTSFSKERIELGFPDLNHKAKYSICAMDSEEKEKEAYDLFQAADVGIIGMTPKKYRYIYKKRLKDNKLVFCAFERVYKKEPEKWQMPFRRVKYFFNHSIYRNKYMLCASAFTAGDFARTGNFIGKTFKWGYFSEFVEYNIEDLMKKKSTEKYKIVWVARYLRWKHPEAMIVLANYLRNKGLDFEINMIGTGELIEEIKSEVNKNNLKSFVNILGSMSPNEVRDYMESSNLFAFTSDRGEGWGVVLNEAMNSGCVPVGSHSIGSVPYLIKDGDNGLIFESENWDDLCKKVEYLITNRNVGDELARKAYLTIKDVWNPKEAAKRFKVLSDCLLNNREIPYSDGPCSKAEPISDDWFLSNKK